MPAVQKEVLYQVIIKYEEGFAYTPPSPSPRPQPIPTLKHTPFQQTEEKPKEKVYLIKGRVAVTGISLMRVIL